MFIPSSFTFSHLALSLSLLFFPLFSEVTWSISLSFLSIPLSPFFPFSIFSVLRGGGGLRNWTGGRQNEFRSGTVRTGVWGCDPQRGSKRQSPWWGSGSEAPWKPALFKNSNHNLYSKLIWDYYKIGCVISTYKFANPGDAYVFRWVHISN